MDCGKYLELLSARLDGELTESQKRELEAHLASCPECRAAEAQLEALRSAVRALEDIPAPERFTRDVMDRVRAGETRKAVPLFRRPRFKALAGLAACLALAAGLYCAGPRETDGIDRMTRELVPDAQTEYADTPLPGEAPGIDVRTVPEDGMPDGEKAVPNLTADGPDDANAPSFAAVITFERLPEGWEELFPGVASPDAMQVSAGEARAFLQLLEEQGIVSEISGSLDENGLCQLLLAEA